MTRILFTINFLTNGGPTRVLQNIIKNLDLNSYDITILTLIDKNNKSIVEDFLAQGIKVVELKYQKSLVQILKDKKRIIHEINKIKADVIHTHGIVTSVIIASKKIRAKKITTIHNNIYEDYKYTYGTIKGIIYALYHLYKIKKFDNVICCSKTSYDIIKRKLKNSTFIRNGIDIENNRMPNIRGIIRKKLKIPLNAIVYVYVGVINKRKRVVELVEMMNNLLEDNEFFIIVGDGNLKGQAQKIANKKIIFTGFKENSLDYFRASDIYVSNSSSEGFSISVIEALNCGLLCLLSDISSHKECFEIDKEIYIGEYFNRSDMKIKKQFVKEHISEKEKKDIIQFAKKELSSKKMTEEYIRYYKSKGEDICQY